MKIKPLIKKRRFRRWLKKLFGRDPTPSRLFAESIGKELDEMHTLKCNIDIPGTTTKKDSRQYYIRAEIIGELPSGQVQVRLLADGTDGYRFYTERRHLIGAGDLFVEIPVDKPCPKCGHVDRYLGSVCEPQSMSMEIVGIDVKEERDNAD